MKTKGLLMIIFLIGMFFSAQAADHVKGNGKLSTKKITIDDFNAIKFDGVIDFNYEQSESTPHIEITVDENLHPYVDIDIKDRVLTVGFKGAKVDHFTKFIVKTNSKWLKEVKASGNANFMANSPLTGDELKINANSNCLVQLKQKVEVGKLDLRPVVKGISKRRAESLAVCDKLFLVSRISRDKSLVNPEISHQTPLIMVARKPDLEKVGEWLVFKDLTLGKVTVVVEDRHILCVIEIKLLRGFILE